MAMRVLASLGGSCGLGRPSFRLSMASWSMPMSISATSLRTCAQPSRSFRRNPILDRAQSALFLTSLLLLLAAARENQRLLCATVGRKWESFAEAGKMLRPQLGV